MSKILVFLLVLGVFQCEKTDIKTDEVLKGEWSYVGTFNKMESYKCYLCPDFSFEKSLYKITFNDDNTYSAKINLLIGKGDYTTSLDLNAESKTKGTFENMNLEILNKPYETEADSKFKAMFSEANSFEISPKTDSQKYDLLTLGSENNEYLLFARK